MGMSKISFLGCLYVPLKFVWWGGGVFHLIMWSHQLHNGLKLGCDNTKQSIFV